MTISDPTSPGGTNMTTTDEGDLLAGRDVRGDVAQHGVIR